MSSKGLSFMSKLAQAASSVIFSLACYPDGTVNRRLLNIADIHSRPSATPVDGVASFDYTVDASRELWFRLFLPVDAQTQSSLPVVFYFHGGGFVSYYPSTTLFDVLCRRLAGDTPAVVVSVNYRHAPEHRCPSQYDDGFDVVKFIDENKDKVQNFPANADLSKSFLAGDSAGGNLAHHVAVRAAESEFKAVRIRGLVAIQPFFGGEERTESELRLGDTSRLTLKHTDFYWKAFLPAGSDRDDPASNVLGSKGKDLSGLDFPPSLVVIGGQDPLRDWGRKYFEWLKRSGKETELLDYPDADHAFYSTPELPEYELLLHRINEFFHKQLQRLN